MYGICLKQHLEGDESVRGLKNLIVHSCQMMTKRLEAGVLFKEMPNAEGQPRRFMNELWSHQRKAAA